MNLKDKLELDSGFRILAENMTGEEYRITRDECRLNGLEYKDVATINSKGELRYTISTRPTPGKLMQMELDGLKERIIAVKEKEGLTYLGDVTHVDYPEVEKILENEGNIVFTMKTSNLEGVYSVFVNKLD